MALNPSGLEQLQEHRQTNDDRVQSHKSQIGNHTRANAQHGIA